MTYKTRFQYLFDKAKEIAHPYALLNPAQTALPPLFFVTDPARIPHPEDIAAHLPAGCGLIYRHFGESHAPQRARLLRKIADDNGLTLLIGADATLAEDVEADGIHLPERLLSEAPALRARHRNWIVTAACHTSETLKRREIEALDAIFVSPVFISQSPSARQVEPLGVKGVRALAEIAPLPVFALGGINCDTIGSLRDSGLSGVAAVDAFNLKD
ncbi:MAG TPA: thiamine phosphate synthase [Asticcacaulis sp.]|nr:thiamine phosphate synthase [Asticcacaulis sp.]